MTKGVYSLKLHESIRIDMGTDSNAISVMRVPGGWIYKTWSEDGSRAGTSFIPFNNEFLG